MKQYQYKIFDVKGDIHSGMLKAESYYAAEKKLKKQEWVIVELKPVYNDFNLKHMFNKVSSDDELFFYLQFSTLLLADIPLLPALEIVSRQIKNVRFKMALESCQQKIKKGDSFSEVLREHEEFFNTMVIGMVEAGEESGNLENILFQISKISEQKHTFRQDIITSLSYPILIMSISVLVCFVIMFYVCPRFLEIFSSNNIPLPLFTIILSKITQLLLNFWHVLLITFLSLTVLFFKYSKSIQGKIFLEKLILKLPFIGNIIRMLFIHRLFFNMALLLKSGVPLLKTIELLAKALPYHSMTRLLADIWVTLRQGGSMSDAVIKHEELPEYVQQIIVVGEQTGKIENLLERIADYYNIMISTKLKQLNLIIEPVLLLGLGAFITFLMASLLLPMFLAVKVLR